MSEFSRETLLNIIETDHVQCGEASALARMALAAMDSEPVAEVYQVPNVGICAALGPSIRMLCPLEPGTKLYRHAQPAPVAPEEMTPQQASRSYGGEVRGYRAGWNACRAAMLQELKKSAGTEAICRSDENVQVLHTKSPAQSDCCPAQNVVVPAQSPIDHGYLPECECSGCKATARICTEMAVNSLVIPNEMTSEQAYEIGYYYGDPVDVFARGANWMRQHIIDSTLAAAPQLPGSDPATVPGKWIPVSERMPEREVDVQVYCPDKKEQMVAYLERNELEGYFRFATWSTGEGIYCQPTHWMPLPAAPQEVKGE